MNRRAKEQIIVSGFAIALLIFLFGRIVSVDVKVIAKSGDVAVAKETVENPFSSISLSAKAAFVFDVRSGEPLFSLNERAQLPLASLTKIMTSLVALEKKGGDNIVSLNQRAIAQEGDHGLFVGERWRLKDLIDVTLTTSSNDGAYALASVVSAESPREEGESRFVELMNEKAKALGLVETFFVNEAGLDFNEGVGGAYGSSRDVARLVEYVIRNHPELFEATTRSLLSIESLDGKAHTLENTNKFVESLPGVIASKTGFTDLAQGNLAVAFEAGPLRPIIVVVLGSTVEGRFADVGKLILASLEHLKRSL